MTESHACDSLPSQRGDVLSPGPMPRPESKHAFAWAQGHERGSVYAGLTTAQRKAFRDWLKAKAADGAVYEAALGGRRHRTKSPFAEV